MPPDEPKPELERSSESSQESEYTEELPEIHDTGKPVSSEYLEEPSETTHEEIVQPQEEPMDIEPVSGEEFDTYLDALDRLSMEQLIIVIDAAQQKRTEKQEEVRQQLVEEFRQRAQAVGMSLDAIFPVMVGSRRSREKPPVAAKYRGPSGELYSGRGVPPKWMQALIDTGHPKADFFIQANGKTQWEKNQQGVAE
jgi:DNA-binding protein H-NS